MKIKNVKLGVRVVIVNNDLSACGVLTGATGTIAQADNANPWVQWDAHTNARGDKRWAANVETLRVLKPKHFPVGTKVVLVAEGGYVDVVLSASKHFLDVRLERTGVVHPFFRDQLRVL